MAKTMNELAHKSPLISGATIPGEGQKTSQIFVSGSSNEK